MGRKIPGKKHRGVKDPHKQQAKRLAELKTKINAPPTNVEEQAIPKSLERVVKLKERVKLGKIGKTKKKKKKKNGLIVIDNSNAKPLHPKAKPDKVIPTFSQNPGESGEHFLNRVNRETQAFLNETEFEKKYGVEVKRDPQTGSIKGLSKSPKDEIDELVKLKMKHNNIKKKKKKRPTEAVERLTKNEKRKRKLLLKKEKKLQDDIDNFKGYREKIEFGEVAHAPPELKARPKKADPSDSAKPGRKNLLLNSLFTDNAKRTSNSASSIAIDRSGKRKDLPAGERRQLEEQQKGIIAAYRKLKADRLLRE